MVLPQTEIMKEPLELRGVEDKQDYLTGYVGHRGEDTNLSIEGTKRIFAVLDLGGSLSAEPSSLCSHT